MSNKSYVDLLLGDNLEIQMGDSGATDYYQKFDGTDAQFYSSGDFKFNVAGASSRASDSQFKIEGYSRTTFSTVPLVEINQLNNDGNSVIFEVNRQGAVKFKVDNEGDVTCGQSITAGNLGLTSRTNNVQINGNANNGFFMWTKQITSLARGSLHLGQDGTVYAADTPLANQSFDYMTIKRDVDMTSTYTLNSYLLKLEDTVTNPNGGTYGYLNVDDNLLIDSSGNLKVIDNIQLQMGTAADMGLSYNGTAGLIDTSLIAPSDLNINCGTDKTIVLDEPVYDDLYIGFTGAKQPSANIPTWSAFDTNLKAYQFALNDYLYINSSEMMHGYKEGTDVEIHIHWVSNGTDVDDRKVKWEVIYDWADMNEAFTGETISSAETTIPNATNVDKTHYYTSIVTVSGAGFKIGAMGLARVRRIASTGTEPTGDPFGLQVGLHYQIDTMGSRQQLIK